MIKLQKILNLKKCATKLLISLHDLDKDKISILSSFCDCRARQKVVVLPSHTLMCSFLDPKQTLLKPFFD